MLKFKRSVVFTLGDYGYWIPLFSFFVLACLNLFLNILVLAFCLFLGELFLLKKGHEWRIKDFWGETMELASKKYPEYTSLFGEAKKLSPEKRYKFFDILEDLEIHTYCRGRCDDEDKDSLQKEIDSLWTRLQLFVYRYVKPAS
jgi:hypothetical protein